MLNIFNTGFNPNDLNTWHPLGTEGNNYVFVRLAGLEGVYLKCYPPRGTRINMVTQQQIPLLRVREVVLNPSAYSSFSGFRQSIENHINPSVYEEGFPVERIDYAVNCAVTMEAGVKGIYWRNRRTFEDYNLESSTATREYIIGRYPHSLAVYDYESKLRRRHQPVQASPDTRFEMRMFKNRVPAGIAHLRSLDQIAIHAGEVINGTVRPFEDVELHDLRLPQMPERYELPMRTYITRHSTPRIRLEQKQRETWAEIRGMMRFATYPELRRVLNVPNGRYQRYWLEMEDTVIILEHFLVQDLRGYFDMDEINRLQSLQNRTWHRNP